MFVCEPLLVPCIRCVFAKVFSLNEPVKEKLLFALELCSFDALVPPTSVLDIPLLVFKSNCHCPLPNRHPIFRNASHSLGLDFFSLLLQLFWVGFSHVCDLLMKLFDELASVQDLCLALIFG